MPNKDEIIRSLRQIQSMPDKNSQIVALRQLKAGTFSPTEGKFNIDTTPVPVDKGFSTLTEKNLQNQFGTRVGSEQSRLLAEQTPGQAAIDPEGFSTKTGEFAFPHVPIDKQERADEGVDIYTGAPAKIRALASTVPNREQPTFLKENMSEALGYETDVRKAPNGDIEYLKKTDDNKMRWTSVNETGLAGGDIAAVLETGPALVGDVAGSIAAGAKASKLGAPIAVPVEALGAAVGTAAGEGLRLGVGKVIGTHDASVFSEALKEGQKAGVAALAAGFTVAGIQRAVRGSMGGLTGKDVEDILNYQNPKTLEAQDKINKKLAGTEGAEDASIIQEQIGPLPEENYRQRLENAVDIPESELPASLQQQADTLFDIPSSERRLKLSAGQTSEGRIIADQEATARADSRAADRAARQREEENINAFEDHFDLLTGSRSDDYEKAGQAVQSALRAQTQPRLNAIRAQVRNYTKDASDDISKLGITDVSRMAQDMQMAAVEQRRLLKEVETAKWDEIGRLSGYDANRDVSEIIIPRSKELDNALSRMSHKMRNSLFDQEKKLKKQLLGKDFAGEETQIISPDGDVISSFLTKGKQEFDLVPLNRSISFLKKLKRQSESGLHPDLPSKKDIIDILSPMEYMRDNFLAKNRPDILETIEDAQQLTFERVRMFDDGAVGRILQKTNGRYHLDDKGVLSTVFANGKGEAARQYATAIMGDPRAMQAARNHIHALYRLNVAPSGIPDRKLHKKFVTEFKDVMSPFFKKEDMNKIKNLGNMSTVINSHAKKLDKVEKAFAKSLRGRVQNMSPENTVPAFFKKPSKESPSGFTKSDVSNLKGYLASTDIRALNDYKSAISAEIRSRIHKGPDQGFSASSVDKLLKDTGDIEGRGKLSELFGNQYAADLRTFKTALEGFEKTGRSFEKITSSVTATAGKVIVGPLDPRSRGISFLEKLRLKSTDEALYDIMSNPEKLRMVLKNRNIDSTTRRAIELYSSIGALSAMNEER